MDLSYFTDFDFDDVIQLCLGLTVLFIAITAIIRGTGLRSLSKMNSYDFIGTLVVGSLIPTLVVPSDISLGEALIGLAWWQILQMLMARLVYRFKAVEHTVNQSPVLLMRNGEILENQLANTAVTQENLMAKLREANALDFNNVRAVILETTGDMSVLHGSDIDLDERLLDGVRNA